MKKLIFLFAFMTALTALAQVPQGFNYQATVRNASGDLIVNQNVYFKFNILQDSQTATPTYSETHYVPTDDAGQVSLVIGEGTASIGVFSDLNWSSGSRFLGIELNTGNGYMAMGTTQFYSVPYALYAESAGSGGTSLPNGQNVGDSIIWDGTAWIVASGNNNSNVIEITTGEVYQVNGYAALSNTVIGSDGGYSITEKGVVWSLDVNPTVALTTKTNEGPGAQNFTSNIEGLSPLFNYYYRAYASNSLGSFYGNTYNFTTSDVLPVVTTTAVSNISYTTATSGLSITNEGSDITYSGIIWSQNQQQLTPDTNYITTGEGSLSIPNLEAGTTYYVRAFATNNKGTAYGAILTFTTQADIPTLQTTIPSQITANTAYSGGYTSTQSDYIDDGGAALTAKGVIWGTSSDLTIQSAGNYITYNCNGNNCNNIIFGSTVNQLQPNTLYYVRAFAVNAIGTGYGQVLSFTTLAALPTVTIGDYTNLTLNSVDFVGNNVVNDGGAPVLQRGVIISHWPDGLVLNDACCENFISQNGTGIGSFTASFSQLQPGVIYYYRAYATNTVGTGYSDWSENYQFTTPFNVGSVIDVDENTYPTIILGTQEWMAENLKVTRFNDGTALTQSTSSGFWGGNYQDQYLYTSVDGNPGSNMYNYATVSGNYNICPQGWRIPSTEDWNILINGLENPQTPAGNLKSNSSSWQLSSVYGSPNGFNLNLNGAISADGVWYNSGYTALLWLSDSKVLFRNNEVGYSLQDSQYNDTGACIRCVKE